MTECEAPKIVSLLSFVPVTVIQRSSADFKSHLGRRFEHERGIAYRMVRIDVVLLFDRGSSVSEMQDVQGRRRERFKRMYRIKALPS